MISNLSDIIKIPAAILAGIVISVLFYEGIRLPWVGQIVPGIVWFRMDAASSNMVTKFERDVLAAQLDKERRDRESAQIVAREALKRADATQRAKDEADAKVEALEAAARQEGMDGWSEEELEWLRRH